MADRATTWAELFKAETGFEHMADTPEASLAWFKRWAEETCQRLDEALASQQREAATMPEYAQQGESADA